MMVKIQVERVSGGEGREGRRGKKRWQSKNARSVKDFRNGFLLSKLVEGEGLGVKGVSGGQGEGVKMAELKY